MAEISCIANLANATLCLVNGKCRTKNDNSSVCDCNPGRTGPNCVDLRTPFTWVYIFDGIFYFSVFAFWVYMAYRRYKVTKGADFAAARLKGVLTSRPNVFGQKTLLAFRIVMFAFALGVHIGGLSQTQAGLYRFYTVWNFIIVIVYFGLGAGLTAFSLWKGVDAIKASPYMSFNASLHYLLLEVELPNTLIVDVVTWAVLLPNCLAIDRNCPVLISFPSFVQHLINFFMMAFDFALSRHAFDRHHWHFNLALPTFYAIFHLFYTIANDRFGHQPLYFFMDASTQFQPVWIIGVLIVHVVLFFVVYAFSTHIMGRRLENDFDYEKSDTKTLLTTENPAYTEDPEKN